MLIRYCPRCRSEFQMQVLECLDCGGPTDVRDDEIAFEYPEVDLPPEQEDEDDDEGARPEREPAIPRDAEVVPVRVAAYGWILDLADALKARDIPFVIAEQPKNQQFGLFVRVEDGETAAAIDREVFLSGLAEEIPEMREGACPACDTDIPSGAVECPECGLILAVSEETEEPETEHP